MFEQILGIIYHIFLSGAIILAWLLFIEKVLKWNKERKIPKVRITSAAGSYDHDSPTGDFRCELNIAILNQKEKTVAINDILATVRYNEVKWQLHHEEILHMFGTEKMIFSQKPDNYNDIIPNNLLGNQSTRLIAVFRFPNVMPAHLDRRPLARFMGLLGKVKMYEIREDEVYRNWDNLPVILRLTLSIDDGEKIAYFVPVYKSTTKEVKNRVGTLGTGDIAEIEYNFWEERKQGSAFEGDKLFQ